MSAIDFKPGDFSFFGKGSKSDQAYSAVYKTVDALDVWDFFDQDPPKEDGYGFWEHPTLRRIEQHEFMKDQQHSGMSWASCMVQMQGIRRMGWDNYVKFSFKVMKENENGMNDLSPRVSSFSLEKSKVPNPVLREIASSLLEIHEAFFKWPDVIEFSINYDNETIVFTNVLKKDNNPYTMESIDIEFFNTVQTLLELLATKKK